MEELLTVTLTAYMGLSSWRKDLHRAPPKRW